MVVSVGVRWGPLVTAVNGTLVARPVLASLIQSQRTEESGHAAALLILL
jgi:hypothetical protein